MGIALGQVVYSRMGRDAGRKFIIVELIDEMHVVVSDGDLRRIEKPKKKKIKHLLLTEEIIKDISEKLKKKQKVINAEIRKALVDKENDQ